MDAPPALPIADAQAEPRRRVRKRRFFLHFILFTLLFSIGDVQVLRSDESGFLRLHRLYSSGSVFRRAEPMPINNAELARTLGVQISEIETSERVLEHFQRFMEAETLGPLDWVLRVNVGIYTVLFSYQIFLKATFSLLLAVLFYLRARDREASVLIDQRNVQLREVNDDLRNKVHEVEELLDQLRRTQNKLVAAEKLASVGRLAATLAHEIRNPLTIIQSAAGMVAEDLPHNAPSGQAVDLIRAEITRLDGIISDLLNFANPKPSRLMIHNLNSQLRYWMPPLIEKLEDSSIDVVLDLDPAIDDVIVDSDQLYQVLLNVIWNARDAMDGPGRGRLTLRTEQFGAKMIALFVADSGPGMSDELKSQIFEPFFTTKTHGTGLGLSIVAQLLEGMGGQVRIDTTVGEGTTVQMLLPCPSRAARDHFDTAVPGHTPVPRRREPAEQDEPVPLAGAS